MKNEHKDTLFRKVDSFFIEIGYWLLLGKNGEKTDSGQ